jgi:hypothetical protein
MILPFLGSTPLAELTRPLVERWRDHLGAHFARATVNGALNVLRSILREADSAAATGVRPLELDDTRITDDEPNALDEEELGRFVAATRALYPQHVALVLVLLTPVSGSGPPAEDPTASGGRSPSAEALGRRAAAWG